MPTAPAGGSATATPPGSSAGPGTSAGPTGAPTRPPTSRPGPTNGPDDPLASQPPIETAPPVGLATCSASDLSVADADAAYTDTAVQELFTVRTTGPDCQLQGYPAVQLLDGAGAAVPATLSQGGYGLPAPAAAPITLSRTTSLSFYVATARAADCVQASTLVVTLPGSGGPLRTATSMQVCSGAVGVGPVQRLGDNE